MPLLELSEEELNKLRTRIDDGWTLAKAAHDERFERMNEAYRAFRCLVDTAKGKDAEKSNLRVPLIQWQVLAEMAKEGTSLFGDDAEIIAQPTGPSDAKTALKVARYVDWRYFSSMKALNPTLEFIFRKIVYGRSHALLVWKRDEYTVLDPQTGEKQLALWYDGPDFIPLWPDDLIVPPETVRSIQDFSWVIVRSRKTWDELLRGENDGLYSDVRKNLDRIKSWGQTSGERANTGDEIKTEADEAEGVNYQSAWATRGSLEVWTWYGYSEPDEDGNRDEWVVTYLPDVHLVIGVQDLAELYPQSRYRRPIVESALLPTGEYWGLGFAELLDRWEQEMSNNANLFTEAQQFSVGPLIVAKPAFAAQLRQTRYEPFTVIESEDPAGVNVIQPRVDSGAFAVKDQHSISMVERLTGNDDFSSGRMIDRPNAPKTMGGQAMMLQQGNIRVSLNMMVLREDMSRILERVWQLECEFPPEKDKSTGRAERFFRVTEEDAGGLFDTAGGGAVMDRTEFAGRYDFDLKFATSVWGKEAKKQNEMQLYAADMQNPLIVQSPKALWSAADRLHRAFGDDRFSDIIPQPPDLGLPKQPKDEWTAALQGDEILVNPLDDDDQHLIDHGKRLDRAADAIARGEMVDMEAVKAMINHVVEHRAQKKQKLMLQAVTQQLQQQVAGAMANPMGGMPQIAGPVEQPQPEAQPEGMQ